jgi:hypothetical protein
MQYKANRVKSLLNQVLQPGHFEQIMKLKEDLVNEIEGLSSSQSIVVLVV